MIKLPESKNVDLSPGYEDDANTLMDIGFNRCLLEIKHLNATTQAVSDGWIRCTDSLPDAEGKYLVYETLNNRVNHDYWMEPEPAEGFWNHYDMNVTHWMPLPAAPGGQDD
ncbi:DUF551 domain-containing protein [Pantoea stewartii]|uniref:DUF551 domain-containing protein n=1 Tax=Pantoea stewartii TaxID=66269 RepID=UPI0025A0E7D3|nr:DUF551 domain-containing protein [Pantoea stewartii]